MSDEIPDVKARIIDDILAERWNQDYKWGADRKLHPFAWMTILGEEFGESCEAALKEDNDQYRRELIQVAATAMAAIESLEDSGEYRGHKAG